MFFPLEEEENTYGERSQSSHGYGDSTCDLSLRILHCVYRLACPCLPIKVLWMPKLVSSMSYASEYHPMPDPSLTRYRHIPG